MDEQELRSFIEWLPELKDNERFYVCLLARNKYAPGFKLGTTGSDRKQCSRQLVTKDTLFNAIRQMEVPVGSYVSKGVDVPQVALAAYINPNPRCMDNAMKSATHLLLDQVMGNKKCNPVELMMTTVHKSIGTKHTVDFDFDGDDINIDNMWSVINKEAVTVIMTRGGFHALVNPKLVSSEYRNTWYQSMMKLPGIDCTGDSMIPIPGTHQGGTIPRMIRNHD